MKHEINDHSLKILLNAFVRYKVWAFSDTQESRAWAEGSAILFFLFMVTKGEASEILSHALDYLDKHDNPINIKEITYENTLEHSTEY